MLTKISSWAKQNPRKTVAAALSALLLVGGITTGVYWALQPTKTSREKPFSVRIQSYRTAKDAKHAMKRLARTGIKAYALKRMEKNNDIWIDVHTGAFAEKAQAEALREELKAKGLNEAQTIEYKKIEKSLQAFDEASSAEKREYRLPSAEIPKMADRLLTNLKHFPIDDNYHIVSLKIADSNSAPKSALWSYFNFNYNYVPKGNTITGMMKNTDAVSQAVYADKLYNWRAGIIILSANNPQETIAEIEKNSKTGLGKLIKSDLKFSTGQGELVGNLYSLQEGKKNALAFVGYFPKTSHVLTLVSRDLTQEIFLELLEADNDGKGLLIFPEVRYNLSIMPKGENNSLLTHFELQRVGWDYAREKGYAWWANNLVNYWNANGYLMKDGKPYLVGFFNVNYDSTARKIHENFMSEKRKAMSNEFARLMMQEMGIRSMPTSVRQGADGWYLSKQDGNELSFSRGSLVVAVDSYRQNMGHDELKAIANELQIW